MNFFKNPPKDASGKTLLDYPRPSVAVDTALLTVHDGGLRVLLVQAPGGRLALPGTFVHPGERLADAVMRSLREKAGVSGRSPQQLHVFDDPKRDERGWVLSVAHVDVVPSESLGSLAPGVELVRVQDLEPESLPYGHAHIIEYAVAHLRAKYRLDPDPGGLLTSAFTLRDLREVHEAVLDEKLQRDTFRRTVEDGLEATGEMSDGTQGRPASLFRVRRA